MLMPVPRVPVIPDPKEPKIPSMPAKMEVRVDWQQEKNAKSIVVISA